MQCHDTTLGTVPKTAKRFEQRKPTVRVLQFGKRLINVQLLVWDKWAIRGLSCFSSSILSNGGTLLELFDTYCTRYALLGLRRFIPKASPTSWLCLVQIRV